MEVVQVEVEAAMCLHCTLFTQKKTRNNSKWKSEYLDSRVSNECRCSAHEGGLLRDHDPTVRGSASCCRGCRIIIGWLVFWRRLLFIGHSTCNVPVNELDGRMRHIEREEEGGQAEEDVNW